jgi:two-component system sensor kinase FixL
MELSSSFINLYGRETITNQPMTEHTLNPLGQMQEGENLSQRVLDSLTAEVAVLDRNGTIIAVNKAWTQFAAENGGSVETTGVGVNYQSICRTASGDDSLAGQLVWQGVEQVLDGSRDVFKFEYPCHSADQQRWFLLYVSRLDATDSYVVMTHLPITERKLTEQRLVVVERLAAIGEAMHGLSHEGRNALQRAQAHIALLRFQLEGNSEGLELVKKIESAQEKLLDLYEEVKSYAAPIQLRYEPYRLDERVQQVWNKLSPSNKQVHFSLTSRAKETTCEINVDAIGQVLDEVFENALAAVDTAPAIEVVCLNDMLDGLPAVTLIISDNGTGVPSSDWEKAFQPFYTTKTRGTGLGLAVSKRIVAAHQGRIQFGTPRLGGTSVYLTLPMERFST